MIRINTYKDMEQFAGSIVAYQPEKKWRFSDGFVFDESPEVKFGTLSAIACRFSVRTGDPNGFTLYEFLKPGSTIMHHGLPEAQLKDLSLSMRAATPEEVGRLQNAVQLGRASHCHLSRWGLDWEKYQRLAERHFFILRSSLPSSA